MTTNPTEGTGRGDIVPLNLDSSGSEEEVDQGIGDSVDELFNLPSHGGNPVEVKRKNKIICTTAYTVLIVGSTAFYTTKAVIWCSIISVLFKFIVIGLCRFNYPQVFNWMVGKHVYVDEKLVETLDPTIGGGMFDVCDIARLSARGSTGGKVRKLPDQRTYVVTQKSETDLADDNVRHSNESDGTAIKVKPTRRPTLVSLTSNASSMFLTLKSAGGSGQIL
ncbi:unnamed protein product [Orchesella dallaii]|uniref:Uncharacterized protein n=1 Tax=Orchesella dallaii TaxID=48710 RepID=A0ABP1RZG3_9HEXA